MAFNPLFGQSIHYGADYNPEQWLHMPEILKDDLRMMPEAHMNIMSLGMFSWAALEKEEGVFDSSWLDRVLDNLNEHGIKVFLSTPSGARPAWLSEKYPEVLRVNEKRQRALHGGRQNHCMTSPVYREKVRIIDTKLAERYAHHPAVIAWHLSNEYGGYCHCSLCQARFREYLKERYGSLDNLNQQWWNTFWSHAYTSWEQIESPSPIGENAVHALSIDWQRFTSHNALDFCKMERDTVKAFNPDLPVTANFMEFFRDYDYFEWAKELDFISWDSYPQWHVFKDSEYVAAYTAMNHDLMRSLKGGQPFVLMESTPSATNWRPLSTLKRPGMHTLASLQAVAHGADSVQIFQWRKSRGSSEKFHGAAVDHVGHLNTRVGREVIDLGAKLEKLAPIAGSEMQAEVALILDTQNRWALEDSQGPRNQGMDYLGVCLDFYTPFWRRGINVDVIDETCDLSKYKVVVAPMTYMLRGDYAERVEKFVREGGTYVSSFWSGIVNDTDLCFLGGFPGPLRKVMGIWEEEIDSLDDDYEVRVKTLEGLPFFDEDSYHAGFLCGLVHCEGSEALAFYDGEFYQGMPVLTHNHYGEGHSYYVAARMDKKFMEGLVGRLEYECGLKRALTTHLPKGVTAHERVNGDDHFVFIGNYGEHGKNIKLHAQYVDMFSGDTVTGICRLPPFSARVLKRIN